MDVIKKLHSHALTLFLIGAVVLFSAECIAIEHGTAVALGLVGSLILVMSSVVLGVIAVTCYCCKRRQASVREQSFLDELSALPR